MNKSQELLENIQELLEYDPFGSLGFKISKHIYLSPEDKKVLLKKRKRIGDRVEVKIPKERKRITSVHKHADQFFGHIQHKTHDNHDLDSNWYELEKYSSKKEKE